MPLHKVWVDYFSPSFLFQHFWAISSHILSFFFHRINPHIFHSQRRRASLQSPGRGSPGARALPRAAAVWVPENGSGQDQRRRPGWNTIWAPESLPAWRLDAQQSLFHFGRWLYKVFGTFLFLFFHCLRVLAHYRDMAYPHQAHVLEQHGVSPVLSMSPRWFFQPPATCALATALKGSPSIALEGPFLPQLCPITFLNSHKLSGIVHAFTRLFSVMYTSMQS